MMRLTLLTVITNVIFYLIISTGYCCILNRRFSWPVTVFGFAVSCAGYILIPQIFPYADVERLIFAIIYFPIVPLVLFKDKWYKSLLCAFAALVIMLLADTFATAFLLTPEQIQAGLTYQPMPLQLACNSIFLFSTVILVWFFVLIMNRYKNRLSGKEWLLYIFFPASQYFLIGGWLILLRIDYSEQRVIFMLAALVICIISDIALFIAIRGMAQRSELKAKNDMLSQQIELQKQHYSDITEQYKNIRRIRHDISSHLYTIEVLLKEGQYEKAREYSIDVSEACRYKSNLGNCENPVVDAFLFSRSEELKSDGYDIQMQVSIPAVTGINDADMIVGFGNILNNAAEACQSLSKKQIYLSARMDKGYLSIIERNPTDGNTSTKKRRIPELERGIGLHILNDLAKKYDGSFEYSIENNEFKASLILKGAE